MVIQEIESKIISYLSNVKSKKILISLSGGVDSISLFHIVNSLKKKIKFNISIYHFNYSIQYNSLNSEGLCKDIALKEKCIIKIKRVNLGKRNFESNAREVRYFELIKYAKTMNIPIILTAHHYDDQIETLLMKKNNRSDWISTVGIREKYGLIRRPLLNVPKKYLMEYAKSNNLKWHEDISNQNNKIYRNNLRNKIIPKLKSNNSNFEIDLLNLNNYSILKYESFIMSLKDINSEYLIKKRSEYIQISNKIRKMDSVEFKLFYQILIKNHFNISLESTKSNWLKYQDFISASKTGSYFEIKNKIIILKDRDTHYVLLKEFYDQIFFKKKNILLKLNKLPFVWNDYSFLSKNNSDKKYFKINIPCSVYEKGIYIRRWIYGDIIYSDYYKKTISVKKFFINKKISIFNKHTIPFLINSNGDIVSIFNLYNKKYKKNSYKTIYLKKNNE